MESNNVINDDVPMIGVPPSSSPPSSEVVLFVGVLPLPTVLLVVLLEALVVTAGASLAGLSYAVVIVGANDAVFFALPSSSSLSILRANHSSVSSTNSISS
jgi:hypothetical protein